jgi:hypothetical protein
MTKVKTSNFKLEIIIESKKTEFISDINRFNKKAFLIIQEGFLGDFKFELPDLCSFFWFDVHLI